MAKRKSAAQLTTGELVAGTVFFVIYLLVLPFVTGPFFRWLGHALETSFSAPLKTAVCYYILFAVTIIIFHGFLARTSRRLVENFGEAVKSLAVGMVALYGLNELIFRLSHLMMGNRTNLNDGTVTVRLDNTPHMTLLIVLLLAPFVEEVLFRGLVFGGLRHRSRLLAYTVSCILFALLHVWQFAVEHQDITYFLLMVQYLVPGLVLAWAYDHSGTLWTSVAVHALANALSVWTML